MNRTLAAAAALSIAAVTAAVNFHHRTIRRRHYPDHFFSDEGVRLWIVQPPRLSALGNPWRSVLTDHTGDTYARSLLPDFASEKISAKQVVLGRTIQVAATHEPPPT